VAQPFTSYEVDNDRSFRDALKYASTVVQDLRIPFGLILRDFYRSEQSIFKLKSPGLYPDFKSGGVNSPYAKAKQKAVGFKYPLLVRSGSLAASLTGPSNKGSISQITRLSLTFGTSIYYGIYHQSDKSRSKILLRKFLFIGPEAPRFATSQQMGRLERWNGILNDFIFTKLVQAGNA